MKKTGRFLVLLMILSLLVSAVPAMADTPKTDPLPILTPPTEITAPDEFELGEYLYVNDVNLQKAEFTAPETGYYYFYQRRIDKVSPRIQIYTAQGDDPINHVETGTPGQPFVMEVYLKKHYDYVINFTYVVQDASIEESKGIFIASCMPSNHMEAETGPWTVITAPANGNRGQEAKHCVFCGHLSWHRYIPGIPYGLNLANSHAVTYKSIKISWKPTVDHVKYQVWYRKGSGVDAKWKLAGTTKKHSYTITGLQMGVKYFFRVRATTSYASPYEYSAYSEILTETPTVRYPASFKAVSNKVGKVKFTWKAREYAQGYIIYRATSANGTYRAIKTVKGRTTRNITLTQTAGGHYFYKIASYRVVNDKKVHGPLSTFREVYVRK